MGQYSMNAYDADVYITDFKGLMQYGDQMQSDLRYSPDCLNVETPGGVLQPSFKWDGVKIKLKTGEQDDEPVYLDPATIGTLMYVRDRNPAADPTLTPAPTYTTDIGESEITGKRDGRQGMLIAGRDVYVIAAGLKLFVIYTIGDLKEQGEYVAEPLTAPAIHTDRWSWCTYELTTVDGTNNILVMSNPIDGVFYFNPSGTIIVNGGVRQWQGNTAGKILTPANFSWIAIYADRLWGVGTKGLNNDTIYYSAKFTILDWNPNADNPSEGGGEIREPSWDKDYFTGLHTFGDGLVAFTRNNAWRITGSDPTNFNIQKQLGNGCLYPDTIVDMGNYLLFLGTDSLVTYDGYQVKPFMKEATYEIFRRIGFDDFCKPFAVRCGDKYVLAMSNEIGDNLKDTYAQTFESTPLGLINPTGTTHEYSQARVYFNLVYDMTDGTVTLNETPQVVSLCYQMPYALTYELVTTGDTTEPVNKLVPLRFDSWDRQMVTDKACKWVSPWITFGRQDIKKGGFDIYFTPEVRKKKEVSSQWWSEKGVRESDVPSYFVTTETEGSVKLKFTIETEKKSKTKEYTVQPISDADAALGKRHKMKRLHVGGAGRRFRLIIETEAGNTIPWRLIGGVHIIAETDKD